LKVLLKFILGLESEPKVKQDQGLVLLLPLEELHLL
jgi:hypothetical protein